MLSIEDQVVVVTDLHCCGALDDCQSYVPELLLPWSLSEQQSACVLGGGEGLVKASFGQAAPPSPHPGPGRGACASVGLWHHNFL